MVQRENFDQCPTISRFRMNIKYPNSPPIESSPGKTIFLRQITKIICNHIALDNGTWYLHRTFSLDHFRVTSNISLSFDIKLSTSATYIMVSPLHSVQMQIITLKLYHTYWICIHQVPFTPFLFYSFITYFTCHVSRCTYQLGESFSHFSPIESQSSLLLIKNPACCW